MCSTPNPVESVFCVKCGARLAPLTAPPAPDNAPTAPPIKGLSLPAKPPAEEKTPPKEEPPAPEEQAAPASEDSTPEWLARLRSAAPVEEEPSPAVNAEPEEPAPDQSDWLTRLRASAPAEKEPAPPIDEASLPAYPRGHVKEEDIPDWLKSTSDEPPAAKAETAEPPSGIEQIRAPEPPPQAPTPTEDKEPTWVSQLRASASAEEPSAPTEESEPAWMSQLRATPSEPAPLEQAPQDLGTDQVPAWLRPSQPSKPTPIVPVEPAPLAQVPQDLETDQIPAWLKPSQPSEPALTPSVESAAPSEPQPTAAVEEPDWLKPLVEEASAAAAPASGEESQVPDWLRSAMRTPTTPSVPAPALLEETSSEELIESLEAASAHVPSPSVSSGGEEEDIPDWLRQAAPSTQAEPIFGEAAPLAPSIEPAQVPEWIAALKPAETIEAWPTGTVESEPVETMGPLNGLRGVLPLANAIAEPHVPSRSAVPADRRDGARIFETILSAPSAPVAAPVAKRARYAWLWRMVLYVLLVLAVIVPFVLPSDWSGASLPITRTRAEGFYQTIQDLPANATVMLAFDYDPSVAGEMDLPARAIVRHLIQRRVKIIAVSTLETGPQIAQNILDSVAREATNYTYGANYLNAGYLAGHEAGLKQLAVAGFPATLRDVRDNKLISQFPAAATVKSFRDVALVIELAGNDDTLKWWMEQVQPSGVKIAAGVSAGVEPKAVAYLGAKQLVAIVSGLVGAAQYEILTNQSGLAVISINAQSAAQILFILVIVVGNGMFWISRARSKKK